MTESLFVKHSGFLQKKGAIRHSWRQRFFGLTQDSLKYWSSDNQKTLKGSIDFRLGGEVWPSDIAERVLLLKPVGDYRTWQLRASSDEERDAWIAQIQAVLTQNAETSVAARTAANVKDASPPPIVKMRDQLNSLSKIIRTKRNASDSELDELDGILRDDNKVKLRGLLANWTDGAEVRVPLLADRTLPHTTSILHWAAFYASPRCMDALLELGANINLQQQSDNTTPYYIAVSRLNASDVAKSRVLACIALLLVRGADIHLPDSDGNEPSAEDDSLKFIIEEFNVRPMAVSANVYCIVGNKERLQSTLTTAAATSEDLVKELLHWKNWESADAMECIIAHQNVACTDVISQATKPKQAAPALDAATAPPAVVSDGAVSPSPSRRQQPPASAVVPNRSRSAEDKDNHTAPNDDDEEF